MVELSAAQSADFRERRRTPRLEILGQLYGELVSVRTVITVREISLGGLRIDTVVPLPVNALHTFRLSPAEGSPVIVQARVVYTRTHEPSPDGTRYTSGLEFVDDARHHSRVAVGSLIDQVTSALSFDAS